MHRVKAGFTTGATLTSSSASSSTAIPTDSSGLTARHVIITATGNVHVKFGPSGVTATANDLMAIADEAMLFDVRGASHVACLEETAGAKVTIAPVES